MAARAARRKNPRNRPVEANARWAQVSNKDPNRWYILARVNDPEYGAGMYLSLGYKVETMEKGGPRLSGATVRDGEELRVRELVLMSISLDEKRRIDQEGIDGMTGQQAADEVEQRMLRSDGVDPMRGIGRGLSVEADPSPPTREV